jgi:membrane protease YdiL (CAAX protease family)
LYEQSLGQTLDPDGPLETLALALAIVVVAPLTEEILFRGYALRAISKRWGRWPALLITTTVFGVAHGEGALLTGALGLIFAWVALRRETIWPTIVAHALINGVSLTLLLSGAAQ